MNSSKLPKISIITVSLNHGRFLKATIESILNQNYKDFEHIVVDGGSTDDTIAILKEYPQIRWISEKDECILEPYRKAFAMAKGEYIFQCCVSDGYLDNSWFKRCIDILDSDTEVSLVWGFPQEMTEDGYLGKIAYSEFFDNYPPQKMDYLPFWLATGFFYPEGNYCVRREVFDVCFPRVDSNKVADRSNPALSFNYNFNSLGFLPYFLPIIANFGRKHEGQRGQRLWKDTERKVFLNYIRDVKSYKKKLFDGSLQHVFRNGQSAVIKKITSAELGFYKRKTFFSKFSRSRIINMSIFSLQKKCWEKILEMSKRLRILLYKD